MCKKYTFVLICFLLTNIYYAHLNAQGLSHARQQDIAMLEAFEKAYPNIEFISNYDFLLHDYKVQIKTKNKTETLYWAGGRLLTKEALPQKDSYPLLLYDYPLFVPNPINFSSNDIKNILAFSNPNARSSIKGTPMFFYNIIYDTATRNSTEQHITRIQFLGKRSNVHESIKPLLLEIENRIKVVARTDKEVMQFINTLQSADSYSWRNIGDSGNRSFHSMGLAIDILPRNWNRKNIYWAWRRDIDGDNWPLLSLDRRWMPPQKVIDIFEEKGFIWGGKWAIWDNMHFEYRPEILTQRQIKQNVQ